MFTECYSVTVYMVIPGGDARAVAGRIAFIDAVEEICDQLRKEYPNRETFKIITAKSSLYVADQQEANAEGPDF